MSFASPGRHGRDAWRVGDPAYALRVWKGEQARQGFRRCFAAYNCLRAMLNSRAHRKRLLLALGTTGSVSVVVSENPQRRQLGRPRPREQQLMTATITFAIGAWAGFVGSEP